MVMQIKVFENKKRKHSCCIPSFQSVPYLILNPVSKGRKIKTMAVRKKAAKRINKKQPTGDGDLLPVISRLFFQQTIFFPLHKNIDGGVGELRMFERHKAFITGV